MVSTGEKLPQYIAPLNLIVNPISNIINVLNVKYILHRYVMYIKLYIKYHIFISVV